ncbi:MAG: BlaI/MecI/CopY family transcriptional regulator [Thermoguttaceae bacterium]|nr:BlaI/MecI/CopY family transcriptional regulator [Thermoguttaceae bacterium]
MDSKLLDPSTLSRREREIMLIIYRYGSASALQICEKLADSPSKTAVRTFLRILERKGFVKHKVLGNTYVYSPTTTTEQAAQRSLRLLLETFFKGSLLTAVKCCLNDHKLILPDEELHEIIRQVQRRLDCGKASYMGLNKEKQKASDASIS